MGGAEMSEQKPVYRYDLAAERAVLGSVILDPSTWPTVADILSHRDYYNARHARIHETIEAMVKAGGAPDLVTLPAAMPDEGPDFIADLASIIDHIPTTVRVGHYARIVANCAQARRLVDEAKELQETIQAGANPDEIYEAAQRLARAAEPPKKGSSVLSAPQMLEHLWAYHEQAQEARKQNANGLVVDTPWPALNALMGGWRGGRRPYVIAAQEKVGKSQVALKSILHAAMQGVPSLFFSLELPHIQVTSRLLGLMSGVSPGRIQDWVSLDAGEVSRVIEAWNRFQDLPITIDAKVDRKAAGFKASPANTLAGMKSVYERLLERGQNVGLIAIDYAQKMDTGSRDERQGFVEISEGIADWATSIPAPILELAQCLSRGKDQKEMPTARDIYGTSQFSKDACCVIICDRPPLRMSSEDRGRLSQTELEEAALVVDIEEFGKTGKVPIRHDATTGNWLPIWENDWRGNVRSLFPD